MKQIKNLITILGVGIVFNTGLKPKEPFNFTVKDMVDVLAHYEVVDWKNPENIIVSCGLTDTLPTPKIYINKNGLCDIRETLIHEFMHAYDNLHPEVEFDHKYVYKRASEIFEQMYRK